MTAVRSYSDTIQRLAADVYEGVGRGQSVFRSASSDYVGKLASIALSGSKYNDPGEYFYHKLLGFSLFVKGYTSVIEALEDFRIDLSLEEFQGDL